MALSKASQKRVERITPYRFQPGKSGNPLGPGYNALGMAKVIRETSGFGAELAHFFFKILRGEAIPIKGRTRTHVPTLDQRITAAQWLADRGWGKAKETIELTGEATTAQRLEILRRLTDEERAQLHTLLARALEPGDERPTVLVDQYSVESTPSGVPQESNAAAIPVESSNGEAEVTPMPTVESDRAETPGDPAT